MNQENGPPEKMKRNAKVLLVVSLVHKSTIKTGLQDIKENEVMLFAITWMDLEIIMLSEVREREISQEIIYVQNLKRKDPISFLRMAE